MVVIMKTNLKRTTSSTSKLKTCSKIPLHNFFFKLKRTFTSSASLCNFSELIQKRNSKTSAKLTSTKFKASKNPQKMLILNSKSKTSHKYPREYLSNSPKPQSHHDLCNNLRILRSNHALLSGGRI